MSTADILNQGWQYHRAGDLARAEALYREALRLNPADAMAWFLLGLAVRGRGALADAEDAYREAVRLRPDFFEALNNLGNVLALRGRPEEAADYYRRVLRLRPDYVEAHNNLGAALRHQGDLAAAEASYREALRRRPEYPDALNNLGDVLARRGRLDDAVACYRQALRLRPDYAEAHSNLAVALRQQGKFDEAVAAFGEALRCRPNYADVHYNLGMAYWENGRPAEAADCHRRALGVRPDYAEALFYLGQALHALGRRDEAVAVYRGLADLDPGESNAEGRLGRALARLILGDYERGWPEYEWRWRTADFGRPPARAPRWDGAPLGGRTILLHAEQGLGETLQFVRYAALVKTWRQVSNLPMADGKLQTCRHMGTVVLACPRPLLGLLAACPGIDRLVPQDGEWPACDVHVSLLSLPGLFGTTRATVPAGVPYLTADPALVEHWRRELEPFVATGGPPVAPLRVGIAWQGNPRYRLDRYRSVPLRHFAPLARVPGVRLFSLQKGPGSEQLRELPADCSVVDLGPRLDEQTGPFLDTAAVMKNLDLVITVDTALAHLAGGLGVRVWVLLSAATDWRWMLACEDSPWYPTARLFRQVRYDDWEGVFRNVDAALRAQSNPGRPAGPP
jgi:tetratricopeptide (TPR) repeat protein